MTAPPSGASSPETPSTARDDVPVSRICSAIQRAWSTGMAKPRPMLPLCAADAAPSVAIAELMPMTSAVVVDERAAGVAGVDRARRSGWR
jgi:hypothetical protein